MQTMRNSANREALTINRRSLLTALAAASAVIPAGSALAVPAAGDVSGKQIVELANKLSQLLCSYDQGNWQLRICPMHQGEPNVLLQPVEVPAVLRLEQALEKAAAALNELKPANYRVASDVDAGIATIVGWDSIRES